jgi:hypothetical protein
VLFNGFIILINDRKIDLKLEEAKNANVVDSRTFLFGYLLSVDDWSV